jgi:DNA-binding IclR family transcriptional regulator
MKIVTQLLNLLSFDSLKDVPSLAEDLGLPPREVLKMLVSLRETKTVGFYVKDEDFGWRLRK